MRSPWTDYIFPSLILDRHYMARLRLSFKTIHAFSQRLPYEGHGGIRSLWGDCILALPSTELPLSYYHGRNIIHRLLNEVINTYSEVECSCILLSVVVSGCPMKGMARYDLYEGLSSPCSPLSCHCRTNMVELLPTADSTKFLILIVE